MSWPNSLRLGQANYHLGGDSPAVTAQDGYKAVELAGALYRSARAGGQVVRLPL